MVKDKGYVVVWLLIAFCVFALGFFALTSQHAIVNYIVFPIGTLSIVAGLWFEAKRDIYAFTQLTVAVTFGGAIITGSILLASRSISWW